MESVQGKKSDSTLDDSLTNIQWLCGLESAGLIQNRQDSLEESRNTRNVISAVSPNPYPKPPYSYATLILLAINSTEDKKMTLQDIYKWIETNYPYYKKCKKAWKNSIRHNLSLHSFFLKEKRPVDVPGKGSYWSISPEGKKNIMQEVMKHAQPIIPNPLGYAGPGGGRTSLRPILPKPSTSDEVQSLPGVCSFVNGNSVMPVVILPTNVYVELASKIANNKKTAVDFAVTQGQDSTIQVTNTDTGVYDLMDEISKNKNFSEALDTVNNDYCSYEPVCKKIKQEEKENVSMFCSHSKTTTPLKHRPLPTLAAMNACNDNGVLFDKDINTMIVTPLHLSTPKTNMLTSKTTSPLPTFPTGLTPLKYDSDSGFFTPLKETDFDFLLSPNNLDQLTPAKFNSTPQGCRKSLKLGTVQEEGHDEISWM